MYAPRNRMPGPLRGLSGKLIATILVVIFVVEIVVYLPSLGNYRAGWLDDRLRVGVVAARVLDAVPDVMALPRVLTDRLLNAAGAKAIVYRREGQSQLIELENAPTTKVAVLADMRVRDPVTLVRGGLDTLLFGKERTLRIVGDSGIGDSGEVELLMNEQMLRRDLWRYTLDFALLALVIAMISSVALYLTVSRIFLKPIRHITANLMAFRAAPDNPRLIIVPQHRRDEIGVAEAELRDMETDIFTLLRQRQHLADLGLAVAKINHDLRNTLASAQLLSDQVATLDDPKVQRLAPRLVMTLDKAIGFAQSVLDYGRQSVAPPVLAPVDVRALVEDAAGAARLHAHPTIAFVNAVPADLRLDLDADAFARVFVNLLKNAREALESIGERVADPTVMLDYGEGGEWVVLGVADNGPGLPPRARAKLFVAFEGSAKAGGTGLGLAIANELVTAHGGTLSLVPAEAGTRFEIALPRASRV